MSLTAPEAITIPNTAKRVPITIVGSASTNASTLLSLLIAGGYVNATDGAIVGYQIEANQPGVVTDRLDFFIANTNQAAAFTAHGTYVKAGVAYRATNSGEVSTIALVSATAATVSAVVTLYLMTA